MTERQQNQVPFGFAKRHGVLVGWDQQPPKLYYRQDTSMDVLSETQRTAGTILAPELLNDDDFALAINNAYQTDSQENFQIVEDLGDDLDLQHLIETIPVTEDLMEQSDDAPIIRLINALLTEAIREGASDIHIEPFETRLVVRFRLDGMLREVVQPRRALAPLLISRIKVMGRLDIAEKRIPQDGRISLKIAGREVDIRVSTIPSNHGERIVLRILDKQASRFSFEQLGLIPEMQARLQDLIKRPHGIILVTGPTGSGKTTTLYAGMQSLNHQTRNIMTVEDPIEYSLPGIGQTQVNTRTDMTFARGLRAILRQDPDVIMIGEIRDLQTAQIAVEASLTGHLVMSTLHTNSAVGAISRLRDMGIEPFLLSSSLLGVVSQRLVRVLCHHCKQSVVPDQAEREIIGDQVKHIYRPVGCEKCRQTGYKGRLGIFEMVEITTEMQSVIHANGGEQQLADLARAQSGDIIQDGLEKVRQGLTSLEEVLRVSHKEY